MLGRGSEKQLDTSKNFQVILALGVMLIEQLEVCETWSWGKFCHIPLTTPVPCWASVLQSQDRIGGTGPAERGQKTLPCAAPTHWSSYICSAASPVAVECTVNSASVCHAFTCLSRRLQPAPHVGLWGMF